MVLDSLDELIRAGFIEELGEAWFRFAHDRFREAITDRLSAEESRRLHARVAEELEKQLGTIPGVAADLAHHYAQSQRPLKAYRFSVLAGDEAMQVYAFPKASDLYQAALTLSATRPRRPSKRLLQRHAEASLQAGRFDAAQDSYNRRLGMLDDTLSKAENLRLLADVQYRRGNAEQAGKLLEDVLRLLGFTVPRTRLAYWWGLTRFTVGYFSRLAFPAWALRVEKPDRKAALGIIARVCIQLSEHYYFREYAMAAFYQVAALSVAERVGAGAELAIATAQQGFLIASHGMRGLGLYFLDRGQRFAKQATPMEQAWGELLRGMVHGFLGEVNANIAAQIRSERLLQLCPETLRLRQTLFQRAEAHLMAGQLKQVESLAQQIIGLADDLKDQRSRGWGLMQQGMVAFRQGQFDTAEGLLEKAPACCGLGGDRNNELVALSRWSLVLACQGELDRAATVALNASNNFNRMKLRNPTAACDGAFLVMAGLLLQRDGKWNSERTQAVRRRERTGGVYARCAQYSRPLYETGRAFCDLAQGKVRSGQQHLERAIAFCETLKLYGPLLDVHRLAAVYFKDQPERAAHHRAQAAALLARLLDAPIPQTPVLAT